MPLFFLDNFNAYLSLEKRYAPNTSLAYLEDVKSFIDYVVNQFDVSDIHSFTHFYVRSWLVSLSDDGVTSRTIHRKVSSLKSYFKYLNRRQGLLANPMQKIILPKIEKHLPLTIRKNAMPQVLDKTQFKNTFLDNQKRLVLTLLYQAGLRRSELINLKLEDINFDKKELRIFGKGGKIRIIPFSEEVLELIQFQVLKSSELLTEKNRYVFCTIKGKKLYPKFVYNVVKNNLQVNTDIGKAGPHTLRHTFATHLADNGADINAIKELLGHSGLVSTQIYIQNSVEKLKKVYKQAHPKGGV